MKAGRIVLIVIGALLALLGFGLLAGGAGALVGYATQRDDDGFFRTPEVRLATPTYAIESDRIDLETRPGPSDWLIDRGGLGTVKLVVEPAGETPVFAGIGPSAEVAAYLGDVSRDQIRDIDLNPDRVRYLRREGDAVPAPPGEQSFWVATSSGSAPSELTWEVESGDWTVVLMNADASPGVDTDARLGIKVGWFLPATIALLAGGLVLLLGGTALAIIAGRGLARAPAEPVTVTGPAPFPPPATPGGAVATAATAGFPGVAVVPSPAPHYPLTITGHLDDELSRGLWLVKWLLAIPHYIVLAFLWLGFLVVTIIAFFAILFTKRYPRSLFDFNVGVLRWSWRVGFYSFSVLGTDRYPPFSLGPAEYPATLDVVYPEDLSRGLVLVKSWLLAIPHYLVVSIFGWGWWLGSGGRDEMGWNGPGWTFAGTFGLIGLLAVFAGVSLLFRGRYPSGIFAFVMGMNRWLYRVAAYVMLMTDEYPPFRLDQGGDEPVVAAAPPITDAVEP